ENGMIEGDGEDLVGTAGVVVAAALGVDHVVEVAFGLDPKTRVEGVPRAVRDAADLAGARGVAFLAEPLLEQAKRVVPERVDLDGFAAAGRDHPAIDLGVHPGELISFGARRCVAGVCAARFTT